MQPKQDTLKTEEGIYLAGDHLLSGSLNAAMASGEAVAKKVISDLE